MVDKTPLPGEAKVVHVDVARAFEAEAAQLPASSGPASIRGDAVVADAHERGIGSRRQRFDSPLGRA